MRTSPPPADEGFAPTTTAYGAALSDVLRCRSCGHGQLAVMPTDVVLGEVYGAAADDEYVEEEAGQRRTATDVLARLERHQPQRGRLLDLGCWVGFLLAEARERGWEVTGVEPSTWAARYAREQNGVDVVEADVLGADLPLGAFDAVVLADVVEHLPDPASALTRIRDLTAPRGVLLLALPDAGSLVARALGRRWWSVIPTHVQYFTRGSLSALLGRAGWQVLEVGTAPKAFSARYYARRLEGYSPALARAVLGGAERAGVADRLVRPDFRDRMLVIARR
ncbi:MAG: class I SAM-dependent methyltransferase [Actinomycetes bacterium]